MQSLTQPELNSAAMRNPIALAFITEAFMLVAIFLGWVYHLTHSWSRMAIYFVLTMCGSLALSFAEIHETMATRRRLRLGPQKLFAVKVD